MFKNIENLKPITGIYLVENLITNKKYIGQSINIKKRFLSHHIYDYKNPKNESYNSKFYQALRKYGLNKFKVSIIEICEKEALNEKEIYWINFFDSYKNGYNSTLGGSNLSKKIFSEESKLKKEKTRNKNNSLKGERHPRARLTNKEVIIIRQRYIDGETIDKIYNDYKYIFKSKNCLKNIIFGKSYKYVGNIPKKTDIRYTNKNKTLGKFDKQTIVSIRKEYKEMNITYSELAKKYNTSISTIGKIINFQLYKNI